MTESQWLALKSVSPLRRWCMKQPKRDLRKERLFACACCRRLWCHFTDARSREAVEAAELFADGLIDKKALAAARAAAVRAARDASPSPPTIAEATEDVAEVIANTHRNDVFEAAPVRVLFVAARLRLRTFKQEEAEQAKLFRDIFGNPFRPVAFDPAWRTDAAVSMAKHMYDARDFSAMPILTDALQDAGCENGDILNHCRNTNQVHVRGCWVADLVLGKE